MFDILPWLLTLCRGMKDGRLMGGIHIDIELYALFDIPVLFLDPVHNSSVTTPITLPSSVAICWIDTKLRGSGG